MAATVLSLLLAPVCKAAFLAMVVCSVGAILPDRVLKRHNEPGRRSADFASPPKAERSKFRLNGNAGSRRANGGSIVYEWEMVSVNS